MQVEVRLFATLCEGRFKKQRVELPADSVLRDLLKHLNIPEKETFLCLVNGAHSQHGRKLSDNDIVALFPPVGGG
jgi:molybdopterin synthase sulfur carrier subunit